MVVTGSLKRRLVAAGRWSVSNRAVRRFTALTGLQGRFHTLYWRAQHRLHGGTYAPSIHDTRVVFHAGTPEEFRHVKTLVGEQAIIEDVLDHVEPGDVFYDVGAYLGVYSGFVCRQHPSVRSVLFEPDPTKLGHLRRNIAANDLDADLEPVVLADETGTVSFATSRGADGPNVSRVATDDHAETVEVEQTSVDALVASGEVPPPSVVKVDVEGGELAVLRGMRETLRREDCRVVYCEVHPTLLPSYGGSEAEVASLLLDAGFEVTRLGDRGQEYHLRAVADG